MIQTKKKLLLTVLTLGILASCSKGENNSEGDIPIEGGDPGSVSLVFPEKNSECTEGTIENNAQSTITFRWEASENTDSYELNVTNLESNVSNMINANTNEADVTLERGKPYEWFVVSKQEGSNEESNSAIWRFYNAGAGVESYAPFPAELVQPENGQSLNNTNQTLEWKGSDVDNDIAEYEVFVDTVNPPQQSLGATTAQNLSITLNNSGTYYWRVVSKDEVGNTSQSIVFEFRI